MGTRQDAIRQTVGALFATIASTARAARKGDAAALSSLQALATVERARPSELATVLGVHQSTITRQMQALEEAGFVALAADPEDRRSCFIALTEAGRKHIKKLQDFGLSRFELFLADWTVEEVRTLGRLLAKLETSKALVAAREQAQAFRRWQDKA